MRRGNLTNSIKSINRRPFLNQCREAGKLAWPTLSYPRKVFSLISGTPSGESGVDMPSSGDAPLDAVVQDVLVEIASYCFSSRLQVQIECVLVSTRDICEVAKGNTPAVGLVVT